MRKLAPEEMSKGYREVMPLFKFGEKRDIAMAALYLASDAGWFYSVKKKGVPSAVGFPHCAGLVLFCMFPNK